MMHRLQACGAVEFIPHIIDRLGDRSVDVVAAAAETLGNFGEPAKVAIPQLRAIATGRTHQARLNAALALHKLDPTSNVAVPALLEMVAGPREIDEINDYGGYSTWKRGPTSELEQAQAADALGSLGSAAAPALPALREAAKSENEWLRSAAPAAIKKIESAQSPT
jgi:HEAT repeat protein